MAGASLGSPFVHSGEDGLALLVPIAIGGSIGIVAGSAFVVNRISLMAGLNTSFGKTLIGSTLGFSAAVACYTHSNREMDFVFFLLPAAGATFFAHLGGYKQNAQQAVVSPAIHIDMEKDYLERTYSCVKVQLVALTF